MQVVCGNCQLGFQAPDGATGLVCPICRSPLRAPDAPADAEAGTAHQVVDWNGGTLDDLVSLLSGPAWSARVEVLPGNGGSPVGEVHVIAGGVSDAIYDGKSTHDALDKLRATKNTRFRIEPRLPNPSDGDLTFPGADQGKLEERPLAHLMRYCEDYVLTAGIEVWRGSENAKVEYRRGEIFGVTVGGIDAPERLAEVMKWSSGSYRLIVPRLTLPETAPKAAVPAVVAPRAAAAASKTIFGMPALDPAVISAAAEKGKAVPAQPQTTAPASAPSMPRASSPAQPSASARSGGIPAAGIQSAPTSPADAAASAGTSTHPIVQPAAPGQSPAMARTIFGVQAPTMAPLPGARPAPESVPPVAAAAAATSASTARALPAKSETTNSAALTAPSAGGEPVKPTRSAALPTASSRAPTVPAAATASPAAIGEDRTSPTKTTQQKPGETPVWTYVGVGFIFGLALLGVYRLVIVLAH